MKSLASLLILLTTLTVALSAADSGSGRIHLDNAVRVGATELPAGDYRVTWSGTADNAQVTLKQGKTIATTTAQVRDVRRPNDGIGIKTENGSRVLTEIQFRDKTLLLQPAPAASVGQ